MTRREKLHQIIFEADTQRGKIFDEILLVFILSSVIVVIIDSVQGLNPELKKWLYIIEWFFTIAFTIEYFTRIYVTKKPWKYIFSFYGIIDLIAILPTYFGLIISGGHFIIVVRILRLLRIFRILKLMQFLNATEFLRVSLKKSRYKILVFMMFVSIIVIILGSVIYIVEGPENGFTSIPKSIYWAIITLTTVGYGDITPQTVGGQAIASFVMLIGYAIIAVPTGIITSEIISESRRGTKNTQVCNNCNCASHEDDAKFCKKCGQSLNKTK